MKERKPITSMLLLMFIFEAGACAKNEDQPAQIEPIQNVDKEKANMVELSSGEFEALPSVSSGGSNCISLPEPTLCKWAEGFEIVVSATVTSVRGIYLPAALTDGTNTIVESCSGEIQPILEFDVDINSVYLGDVADSRISIRFSRDQAETWRPEPRISKTSLEWIQTDGSLADSGIGVGSEFIVGLVFDAKTGSWNPAFNPLINNVDGRVDFQPIEGECAQNGIPLSSFPLSINEFEQQLTQCTITGSYAGRLEVERTRPLCIQ